MKETKYTDEIINLEHLAEEAAEILHIKSKCVRFGMKDYHPKNGCINKVKLGRELGHLMCMVDILLANKTVALEDIMKGKEEKHCNLSRWYDTKTATAHRRRQRWQTVKNLKNKRKRKGTQR